MAAVSVAHGRSRTILLDDPKENRALVVNAEGPVPVVGRSGLGLVRRRPHLAFDTFLPMLGQSKPWQGGRHSLTPDAALRLAFDAVSPILHAESNAVGIAFPTYLTTAQVERTLEHARAAGVPVVGAMASPLALVADRAAEILSGAPVDDDQDEPVAMPLHGAKPGPGSVLVIDADDHSLNGSIVAVEPDRVMLLASMAWPRTATKNWLRRLIDSIADQCVRLCRRDPRDSADAEQDLFDQLLAVLERGTPERFNLTVRAPSWYQVVVQGAEEFADASSSLVRFAVEDVQELIASTGLANPPRLVWLTAEAGRLPGLRKALHAESSMGTAVDVLPAGAVALAAARLVPRWQSGVLPAIPYDTQLKIEVGKGHNTDSGRLPRSAPPGMQGSG